MATFPNIIIVPFFSVYGFYPVNLFNEMKHIVRS